MNIRILACTALLLAFSHGANAAEDEVVITGVVTSVNTGRQTITVRNDATGERRLYFVGENTRLSSNDRPINLTGVKKGNTVTLRYRATDTGREVSSFQVTNPDMVTEVAPIAMTGERSISGVVTGVKPSARTLTVREDTTRTRRTLVLPEDASITRDGRPIRLRQIAKGDQISARYRVTDEGLIIASARSPEPTQPVAAAPTPALPKTAGHVFVYPLLALALFGAAAALRLRRRVR